MEEYLVRLNKFILEDCLFLAGMHCSVVQFFRGQGMAEHVWMLLTARLSAALAWTCVQVSLHLHLPPGYTALWFIPPIGRLAW